MKWRVVGAIVVILLLALVGFAYHKYSVALNMDIDAEDPLTYMRGQSASVDAVAPYHVASSTPQFVVLSFDGSKSTDMLKDTLDFEDQMAKDGSPVKFTYFINAAYFLTADTAGVYQGPGHAAGVTNIGFSNSSADIAKRMAMFNTAYQKGNEIASHSVGHFNGIRWSYDDWAQEFKSFATIMGAVPSENPSVKIDQPLFINDIKGFRAPELGVNNNLYKVEKDFNFTYDASGVGQSYNWPYKDSNGIWHIPLGTIRIGASHQPGIAMDYSLWVHQTQGKNTAVRGTPLWYGLGMDVKNAYTDYFESNYNSSRAPIVIGNHFSKWNDGVYWDAMKAFASEVCGKPQVRCVTFSELVDYLNANGTPAKI